MRYFLIFLLPPVAVLLRGKPLLSVLNLILTLSGWIPGVIHALLIINDHKHNESLSRRLEAVEVLGRA
ncbi:MAG: YqaE/Pmp3 family membrane protein [Fuerstiella sp.]|nr:YqaE/Pmp3 family membrane protein [Fuerstiella sp.]MCP4508794.1 YqaE/Pmp3 family membrane protein [Fuerstiella sp.]MDG2129186.1 YqaE/Pmp3 family membrane protein [Fuerstiella sp.]